ncbi:MAG: hypothetical protein J7M39_02150 [Anaerolineae bacterium]|nr:hypothetical protein [Anaerolineae bacterium]
MQRVFVGAHIHDGRRAVTCVRNPIHICEAACVVQVIGQGFRDVPVTVLIYRVWWNRGVVPGVNGIGRGEQV